MKVERLCIDGFGHFHQRDFGPLAPGLVVFHGPNEAGKTTLLEFLRVMLFGFDRSWKNTYPPRAGGIHGGRVVLLDEDGRRYVVDREAAPNRGKFELTGVDGQPLPEALLGDLLGHATAAMYRTVFAFGLGELADLDRLQKGEVGAQIYSAGLGAGGLQRALRALGEEAGALFAPRGSKQEIALLRDRLQAVEQALQAVAGDAASHGGLVQRQREIERRLATLGEERARLAGRRARVALLAQAWPDWVERGRLADVLDRTPPREGFPGDAVPRLDRLEAGLQAAARNAREAEEQLAREEEEGAREPPGRALLALATRIEACRRGMGAFENARQDLPRRTADIENARQELMQALANLGPGWDEARLRQVDLSLPARAAIDQWGRRLAAAEQEVQARKAQAEAAGAVLRKAQEDLTEAEAEQRALGDRPRELDDLRARREVLPLARAHFDTYVRARDRRVDAEQAAAAAPRAASPASWWPLLAVAAAAAAVLGMALGGAALVAGLAGAAGLGGLAAWLALRQRDAAPAVQAEARLRQAEGTALAAFEAVAAPLGIERPEGEALAAAEARIGALESLSRRWEDAAASVDRAGRDEARARRELAAAADRHREATGELAQLLAAWQATMQEHGLPGNLDPAGAARLLAAVESTLQLSRASHQAEDRRDKVARNIETYRAEVAALVHEAGLGAPTVTAGEAARAAADLFARFDEAKEAEAAHRAAQGRAAAARATLELRRQEEAEAGEQLDALLARAGATDGEQLRLLAAEVADRRRKEEALEACDTRLRSLVGGGEAYTRLLEDLAAASPEALQREDEALELALAALGEERDGLNREAGEVRTSLSALTSNERGSELRAERETLIASLQMRARAWARARLAVALLERARARYEQERQPAVVRAAEACFRELTAGRYTRLRVPLDERTVLVAGEDGREKTPAQLSRGTSEQLYLALRFGLIEYFGENNARLPVIVDDALVNFDPRRSEAAARAFAALSAHNQVLVFTCHPHLVEVFQRACPGAQVIEIGDGDRQPGESIAARSVRLL